MTKWQNYLHVFVNKSSQDFFSEKVLMASGTKLSHLIEKKICRELIHGAYDESGRIKTDNDSDEYHFENIFTGPSLNDTTENKEEVSDVSDSKNDLSECNCEELTRKVGRALKNESPNDHEEHDDKTTDRNSNTAVDTRDEIDYFDSDEEYLETRGLGFDDIDTLDEYDEYFMPPASRGGRYSE